MHLNLFEIRKMIRYFLLILFLAITLHHKLSAQDLKSSPNPNGKTKVYISLLINNIGEINAASQIVKADVFFAARWSDPRLAYSGSESTSKSFDDIWSPLVTISNRLGISKSFADVPTILNDGTVIYFQRFFGDLTEDFQFEDFPFDTQTFEIKVIAAGQNASEVELVPDDKSPSGISDKLSMPEWKILDWKFDTTSYSLMKGTPELPALTMTFRAKRESGFLLVDIRNSFSIDNYDVMDGILVRL
jgi:Neurotransmitter-gated ion-channel ligand binding domain